MRLLAVRGATTLNEDSPEAIQREVRRLLEALASQNHIQPQAILSVFFTLTPDIHSLSPAKAAREAMPWEDVALFCAVEPEIEGLPPLAIRVLIQYYPEGAEHLPKHVYLNGAKALRPDRG